MPKRLVLTARDKAEISLADLEKFVETARLYGVSKKNAAWEVDEDGILRFGVSIPPDMKVLGGRRVVKIKKKTKGGQAVDKQLDEHDAKKKKGEREAYVPPVGRKGPPKPKKIKCPRCGIRKPITKVNKMNVLKPHQAKGEPCPGSGVQV